MRVRKCICASPRWERGRWGPAIYVFTWCIILRGASHQYCVNKVEIENPKTVAQIRIGTKRWLCWRKGKWCFGEIKPCGPLRHDLQLSHRLTSINHQTRQNVLQRNFLMPQTTFFAHILTGMRHAVNLDACDMTWHSCNTSVCFTGEINFKEASLFHQTNYWCVFVFEEPLSINLFKP